MKNLTFKGFVSMIHEELADEITKMQGDIATIDTMIAQRTKPLLNNKLRLQKMLAAKQQQQANQQSKTPPATQPAV